MPFPKPLRVRLPLLDVGCWMLDVGCFSLQHLAFSLISERLPLAAPATSAATANDTTGPRILPSNLFTATEKDTPM